MTEIFSWVLSSLSGLVIFLKFLIDLPILLVDMFVTFPSFYRIGFTICLSMLIVALVIRIKSYMI